ncbi:HRDC domain-containing protein [Arcticibacter sp. MXS-1]|uniref:HRDC domain-containing protein n=1 Tax=Arcticibacter sp. MXS-1 TaxID=3341726 RepID=UPI0035A951F7
MILTETHELILKFIEETDSPLFLTGKAGTGKTTFLNYVKANVSKNLAVVAPTAVAAINAGGVTINSFFQVPYGPLIFEEGNEPYTQSSPAADKVKLLLRLELLIIDEVSMVRCDMLDYVDRMLRTTRGSSRPFGGVQVLMVGDPYQLPPVFEKDWALLSRFYEGPYFFNSRVFKQHQIVTFELKTIHRQSDPTFIGILNSIRDANINDEHLSVLNGHLMDEGNAVDVTDYVTLTTHNKLVKETNEQRLAALPGELFTYAASISDHFPAEAYPAEEKLQLKVGAQVMFIKNDSSGKKQYYNGRTAKVTELAKNHIRVEFRDDHSELDVPLETWQNVRYALSEGEKEVSESNAGTFTQYPLRLAWAITIHKSQGLSFDKAVIDVASSFAHGQVYVALSRCRNLQGLLLRSPLRRESVMTDLRIVNFMREATCEEPDGAALEKARHLQETSALLDLFDFSLSDKMIRCLQSAVRSKIPAGLYNSLPQLDAALATHETIRKVAAQFSRQELSEDALPLSPLLQGATKERLAKAATYFSAQLALLAEQISKSFQEASTIDVPPVYFSLYNQVVSVMQMKLSAMTQLPAADSITGISKEAIEAGLNYEHVYSHAKLKSLVLEKQPANPALFEELLKWRKSVAGQKGQMDYTIMPEKALWEIADKQPSSLTQLAKIKSFGQGNTSLYGEDILKLVRGSRGEQSLF